MTVTTHSPGHVLGTGPDPAFSTLLIANRGEIALRVIRTARRLGLRTVAVHTDADTDAPHTRAADTSVRIGSYLAVEELIAAAQATGAEAVHPGYGFLSERAEFAAAVARAGLILVGPTAEVMEQMGRKDAARGVAVAAGVPVVPSFDGAVRDGAAAVPASAFPVLVKAASGGGGKGMRVVASAADFDEAVASARREAAAAFGDDTLLVEKFVPVGRHIEVQVLGDHHGNVVHLFERDCSTQRRHQKVLEEAPAPTLSGVVRHRITEAAVRLARQVGYRNAGTVEFLLDTAAIGEDGEPAFYFLEMNTRLQVEHPVTELAVAVAGAPLDLVELQLRIAAGEPLAFDQEEVALVGHAIEARVYAEDPYAGFLPQAGTASWVHWPERARVDAALESGQVVSTSYDPMLGKVITHGHDRETARRLLSAALADTAILGLSTNTGFLRALVDSAEFTAAGIDTGWLDRAAELPVGPDAAAELAVWAQLAALPRRAPDPFRADGWRLGADPAPIRIDQETSVAGPADHGARIGEAVLREISRTAGEVTRFEVLVQRPGVAEDPHHVGFVSVRPHQIEVVDNGRRTVLARPDAFADHGPAAGDGVLLAPMPGTVLAVDVAEGETVEEGTRLGVLEAMKMEVPMTAPFAGRVVAVGAAAGEQVRLHQLLFEVVADD